MPEVAPVITTDFIAGSFIQNQLRHARTPALRSAFPPQPFPIQRSCRRQPQTGTVQCSFLFFSQKLGFTGRDEAYFGYHIFMPPDSDFDHLLYVRKIIRLRSENTAKDRKQMPNISALT